MRENGVEGLRIGGCGYEGDREDEKKYNFIVLSLFIYIVCLVLISFCTFHFIMY